MSTTTAPTLRDRLVASEETARDQQHNIDHVAALLVSLAREGEAECMERRDGVEMTPMWLRVEYLARQLQGHSADLDTALGEVEVVAMKLGRAAP